MKDRVIKEIFIFSTGFLHLIDRLFWNLPFTSAVQAEEVRVEFEIPDNMWDAKWKQISSGNDEDGARDQLHEFASGYKAWLAQHSDDHSSTQVAAVVPSMRDGVVVCYVIEY